MPTRAPKRANDREEVAAPASGVPACCSWSRTSGGGVALIDYKNALEDRLVSMIDEAAERRGSGLMEAKLVRVNVHGKRERLPTHVAAERMVERYGEAVYSQEVFARRSAFFEFWREVDEALAARLGEAELRRRVCAIVEQGRVPAIDLLDILSAYDALEGR